MVIQNLLFLFGDIFIFFYFKKPQNILTLKRHIHANKEQGGQTSLLQI